MTSTNRRLALPNSVLGDSFVIHHL